MSNTIINTTLLTSTGTVIVKGSLLAFTYSGEYYERLQCVGALKKIVEGVGNAAGYAEFAYKTYEEYIQASGNWVIAGTAAAGLTIEQAALDLVSGGKVEEPSITGHATTCNHTKA